MAGGWGNPLMQKEDEFLVLDGMYVSSTFFLFKIYNTNPNRMIALAVIFFTVFHPGLFLRTIRKGSWGKARVP